MLLDYVTEMRRPGAPRKNYSSARANLGFNAWRRARGGAGANPCVMQRRMEEDSGTLAMVVCETRKETNRPSVHPTTSYSLHYHANKQR